MSVTNAALLSAVEDAILALVSGAQTVTFNGRSITKSSLSDLYAIRRELRQEAGLASSKGGYTVAEF
jgi:hypothetical protein